MPPSLRTQLFARICLMLTLAAFSSGCQTTAQPLSAQMQQYRDAKPMTAEEESSFLQAAESAQAMAPAITVTNSVGGLDPTGVSRMAMDVEMRRRAAEVQKHVPAMMATNVKRVEQYCATRSQIEMCQEFYQKKAELGM